MIKTLRKEQKTLLPVYRDKWLKIGLNTKPFALGEASPIITYLYENILKKPVPPIVILDSPYKAWLAVCMLTTRNQVREQVRDQIEKQVWGQVWGQVGKQVWSQVWSQVWEQVWSQVWNQIENQVRNKVWERVKEQVENQVVNQVWEQVMNQIKMQVEKQVREKVREQVWEQVGKQVWEQIWEQVGKQVLGQILKGGVESNKGPFVWPYLNGQYSASSFGFYDYIFGELDVIVSNKVQLEWYKSTSRLNLIYPLDSICVLCQPPEKIARKDGVLHCEDGPAIQYPDCPVYALNGIVVKEDYVLRKASEIPISEVLAEMNVDVRRELVRKLGLERFTEIGKLVDVSEHYKLLDMASLWKGTNMSYAPYLLMKNPSLDDTWHLEAVSKDCKTVEQANNWRVFGDPHQKWSPEWLS